MVAGNPTEIPTDYLPHTRVANPRREWSQEIVSVGVKDTSDVVGRGQNRHRSSVRMYSLSLQTFVAPDTRNYVNSSADCFTFRNSSVSRF